MRITYVLLLDLPSTKAHALQTVRTAVALAERGVEVDLHPRIVDGTGAAAIVREWVGTDLPKRVRLRPLPFRRADLARAALTFRLLPALVRPDAGHVLLARERRAVTALIHLRRWTGRRVPLVYEFHDLDHVLAQEAGDPKRARRILRQEARIAAEADVLLATAEPLAREVEARLRPARAVEVIPNGVDLERFRALGDPDPGAPTVRLVYAGSLYPGKGVDTLVRAMSLLPERVRLTVVGGNTPGDLDRLRALAGLAGTAPRIEFAGQCSPPDVPGQLARGDVLVIPAGPSAHSLRFTSPLKLFEAMATGIPLVVGPSPALLSVVEAGETAEVADDAGPGALADAVMRVIEAPDRALAMAGRAAVRAEDYSWARRAERVEDALRRVLAARQP